MPTQGDTAARARGDESVKQPPILADRAAPDADAHGCADIPRDDAPLLERFLYNLRTALSAPNA